MAYCGGIISDKVIATLNDWSLPKNEDNLPSFLSCLGTACFVIPAHFLSAVLLAPALAIYDLVMTNYFRFMILVSNEQSTRDAFFASYTAHHQSTNNMTTKVKEHFQAIRKMLTLLKNTLSINIDDHALKQKSNTITQQHASLPKPTQQPHSTSNQSLHDRLRPHELPTRNSQHLTHSASSRKPNPILTTPAFPTYIRKVPSPHHQTGSLPGRRYGSSSSLSQSASAHFFEKSPSLDSHHSDEGSEAGHSSNQSVAFSSNTDTD